jgi:hypothetical protein
MSWLSASESIRPSGIVCDPADPPTAIAAIKPIMTALAETRYLVFKTFFFDMSLLLSDSCFAYRILHAFQAELNPPTRPPDIPVCLHQSIPHLSHTKIHEIMLVRRHGRIEPPILEPHLSK